MRDHAVDPIRIITSSEIDPGTVLFVTYPIEVEYRKLYYRDGYIHYEAVYSKPAARTTAAITGLA